MADPVADYWDVAAPLVSSDAIFGVIEVPVGFRTNLESSPAILHGTKWFDPNGPSREEAVTHDWLYTEQSRGKDFADRFFRAALLARGINSVNASFCYYALKWFGFACWEDGKGGPFRTDFVDSKAYFAWVNGRRLIPPADHA